MSRGPWDDVVGMRLRKKRVGLVGEVLIDTSSAISNGDKISRDERVAGWLATLFRHKLPHVHDAALELFSQGWASVVDSRPKEKVVHRLKKRYGKSFDKPLWELING